VNPTGGQAVGSQKNVKPKEAERRAKIQAAREAQRKAERRKRNIIIGVVILVVAAIVAAIAVVVVSGNNAKKEADAPATIPTEFEKGASIIISDNGVGEANPDLDTLTIYYSYSCHACAYLDSVAGPAITKAAQEGAFNLELIPVANVDYPWRGPATNAVLQVAAYEPDKFIDFHLALSDYFNEQFNEKQDDTVMADLDKSVAKVKEIAEQVGIKSDVIAKFGDDADAYTDITTEEWRNADVDYGDSSLATPEVVYNKKVLTWTVSDDGDDILNQFLDQMKELGYTDPRS
jgi:hypothetical protein